MSIVDYISSLATPDCCMIFDYFNKTRVKFEELIPGYRTNSVTGRDSLSTELTETTNKFKDGTDLERSRHQTRDITVTATLVSETTEAHRKNLDLLKGYLHRRDSDGSVAFVFADEPDVYYEGIVSSITETPLSTTDPASTITITLHCPKPYKYSTAEYECVNHAVDDSTKEQRQIITVDYKGTARAYPEITIETAVEYGFVGLASQDGRVLQLGDPDELDRSYYATKTKDLTNPIYSTKYSGTAITGTSTTPTVFKNSGVAKAKVGERYMNTSTKYIYECTTAGAAAKAKWKYIGKILEPAGWAKNTNTSTIYSASTKYPSEIPTAAEFGLGTKGGLSGIVPTNVGTGNGWHGPSIIYTVPTADRDINGIFGWYHYFAMQTDVAVGNLGCQQFAILDWNKRPIALVDYRKNKPSDKSALVQMFIGTNKVHTIEYEPIRYNDISGKGSKGYGNSHIYKYGKLIIFDINGKKFEFKNEDEANTQIAYVVAYAAASIKYSQMDSVIGALKYSRNAGAIKWKDIPNKIKAKTVYYLDCARGKIFDENAERPELGALGNDWEEFYLKPGINQFECLCSDWYSIGSQSNYKSQIEPVVDEETGEITYTDDNGNITDTRFPKYTMTYREVFI